MFWHHPNFIDEAECRHLYEKAVNLFENGQFNANPSGPCRFYKRIDGTIDCDNIVNSIAARLIKAHGIDPVHIAPQLGWLISLIQPGGTIHIHKDSNPEYQAQGKKHLRCNIVICKNPESGNAIVEGVTQVLRERDAWAFFASESAHGTTVVEGPKDRIVYQFGFIVPENWTSALQAS